MLCAGALHLCIKQCKRLFSVSFREHDGVKKYGKYYATDGYIKLVTLQCEGRNQECHARDRCSNQQQNAYLNNGHRIAMHRIRE